MLKKKVCLIGLLAAAALLLAGKTLVIQVMRTNIKAKPDFLSNSLGPVQKGAKLELIETQGSWYQVRSASGLKGYVHQTAVTEGKVTLGSIAPGPKGASQDELVLAAKGFDEGNENKLRGSKGYNFADLEWVMAWDVADPALMAFMRAGGLK
jgi:uncharacterized protein YgiM (DUF1202 family)